MNLEIVIGLIVFFGIDVIAILILVPLYKYYKKRKKKIMYFVSH